MKLSKMGIKAVILFAAGLIATAAHADGFYISTFTGLAFQNDQNSTANGQSIDISLDNGFVLGGSLGYNLPISGFRVELELAYRENGVTAGEFLDDPTAAFSGDTSSLGVFTNALYDFDSFFGIVAPYVGVGLGYGGVESDTILDTVTGGQRFGGPTRSEFLYQGILGATISLTDTWDVFVDGRYYVAPGVDFDLIDTALNTSTVFNSSYEVLQLQAGLRYKF